MELSDSEKALIESAAKALDSEFEGIISATEETLASGSIDDAADVTVERFGVDLETASNLATIGMLLISVVQQLRQPEQLQIARDNIEKFLDILMDNREVPLKARRLPLSKMRKVVKKVLEGQNPST